MIAAALPAAFQVAAPAAEACVGGLCDAERLRPVFAKLAEARSGGGAVHILQIGDSHTAGDQVTGSWRTLLQGRYGSAGRGVMAPGRPYGGYLTRGIQASMSPGWRINGLFGNAWSPDGPPVGISGYSATSATPGATMSLAADAPEAFDLLTVCAVAQPGGGTLTLTAGNLQRSMSLAGDQVEPTCLTMSAGAVTTTASVTLESGQATITSWATARSGVGGVILSNLGTVGAQLVHFGRSNDRVVSRELASYQPDLIVIAFGTNEAFSPDFSPSAFEATLRGEVARLRRFAPGVPILLLGAPDSGTRNPQLIGNAYGSAGACPVGAAPPPAPTPEEDGAPEPQTEPPVQVSAWAPTRALPLVQATQRRVAHALGLAFWDWSARMGGRCTASLWANAQPPLMRGDHVHFTTLGAAIIAERLEADLLAAAGQGPSSAAPSRPWVITPGGSH